MMAGLVHELERQATGEEVADLHAVLIEMGYEISVGEIDASLYGESTEKAIRQFQSDQALQPTGVVDKPTAGLLSSSPGAKKVARTVTGTIGFDYGAPASNLDLRLYNRVYGGKDALLAQGRTQADGTYSLSYRSSGPVNLELRTVDPKGKEVSVSQTKFGAASNETLDVVAPSTVRPLAPEYDRLAADLQKTIGGAATLANAQETNGREDLSIAHQATGWDARLLALAASAEVTSAQGKVPADVLYGLYRAGLPTDPARLARVDGATIDTALERVVAAGVIANGSRRMKQARTAITELQQEQLKLSRAPGAISTFGDLLAATGLNAQDQQTFQALYLSTPSNELWDAAAKDFPQTAVNRLRAQGKLAALTLNNAPLMATLQEHVGAGADLSQLVDAGFHDPAAWEQQIRSIAAKSGNLDAAIPSAYPGATPEDRLSAYATDLARKVRLAYPTRVVGQLLEDGTLKLENGAAAGTFLKQASANGFELGRGAIAQLFDAEGADVNLRSTMQTIERVYQITPSNEAMGVLFEAGLHSARDVVSLGWDRFNSIYGGQFNYPGEGGLIWHRSELVSTVTYGLFTGARGLDSSTPVHAISGDSGARQAAKDNITKQYPSMAELFGSLDFCECKECRSVLSPAAYLVDILQYINPSQTVWDAFTTQWNADHPKQFADNFAADYDKPFDQLDQRRPDIKNLPLTCENTNTALPYIDVVNEILEYYVANGSLAGDKGNDTGEATSEELLAEPQFVIPQAYQTLLGRKYPIGLPFDLWMETVRAFLAYFDMPLWQLLETFRSTDELFRPQGGAAPYYRSQIFVESLGISPAEWGILTAANPAASWWTLYGDYASENAARTDLASAKTLARVLGLSYRELIDVVETQFVNPQLAKLVILSKIGIDVGDVYRYENAAGAQPMSAGERTAFEQQLTDFQTATGFNAAAWLQARYNDGTFDKILVLADPDAGCDFNATTLQYANGDPVTAVDWVKINLLIRLWRRLGWSLNELDVALTALIPVNALPLTNATLSPALATAILYLAHVNALTSALSLGRNARLRLPTLWTDISTTGAQSLYAQLFLTPSALKNDPVFDDPTGDYLHDNTKLLKDHRLGVQAALALTAGDVDAILADVGIDPDTAPLSLDTVSVLYRYGLLARALKLKVPDFIAMKALSGLDPFMAIEPDPLNADPANPPVATIDDDHPFSQTIKFIEVAEAVKASGFAVAELEYLLIHDPDAVARFRPDEAPALALLRSLRTDIARIVADNSPPDDPTTLDDETLRQKLALILRASVVDTLMAMWQGTVRYDAVVDNVLPGNALDPAPLAGFPISVSYDAVQQEQRLTFTGVLLDPQKQAIENADNSALLAQLLDDVEGQASAFFARWCGDFLAAGDYATLFAPIPTATAAAQAAINARRTRMAAGLYPYLQSRLIRQLVITSVAAADDADPVLAESLITDPTLLYDSIAAAGTPLLDAFAAAGTAGLSAQWYPTADCTGNPSIDPAPTVARADTVSKPNGTNSVRFSGCIQVTDGGPYRFFAHLDKQNASVTLTFEGVTNPVISATAAADNDEPSGEIDLKPGVPYPFIFEVHALGGGDARLLVLGETLPKDQVDKLTLYPQTVFDRLRHADVVVAKVLRLINGFSFDETEIRYLLTNGADFDNLDLSQLPASETTAGVAARFTQFLRLAAYAALKSSLGLDGDELIDVFSHARRIFDAGANQATAESDVFDDTCSRIASLTRRDAGTVETVAAQLGFAASGGVNAGVLQVELADVVQERGLGRLWDALSALQKLGVPADSIGRWVPIVNAAAGNRDQIADDVTKTVKARFEETAWYTVAQPIFDTLRKLKRDALVAYILDEEGLDTPDKLYEQFLLDPEMEPVVQTSRIQLAISSVQLFIQRCLLNLEERVPPPAIIDASEWEWMKRYRIWEANRQIFLYPENWLEPEFRQDKTSLFSDLEGALLQGDVTPDAAEDAFLGYLQTLETIARLQIVSMYVEEPDDGVDILHVIGRTYAGPHKYYYRTFTDEAWEPWTPVDVEIEGDHVVAVKWRNRIHLFWLSFVEKTEHNSTSSTPKELGDQPVDAVMQKSVDVRLNWSSLVHGAWTPRQSGPPFTTLSKTVTSTFDRLHCPIWVTKETRTDSSGATVEGAVLIQIGGEIGMAFRIATKNSPPTSVSADPTSAPISYYSSYEDDATLVFGSGALAIYYPEQVTIEFGMQTDEVDAFQWILGAAPNGDFGMLMPDSALRLPRPDLAPLAAPFFYEDDTNTFFVAPEVTETTIREWDRWIIDDVPNPMGDGSGSGSGWVSQIPINAQVPHTGPPVPDGGDPWSKYEAGAGGDWVTNPATVIGFGGAFVNRQGGVDLVPAAAGTGRGTVVQAGAGSTVGAGTQLFSSERGGGAALAQGTSLLIVGRGGVNATSAGALHNGAGLAMNEAEGM
jgi:peptidoglycan hydrolase-like protein with peptidoglycan-binding domain